MKCDICLQEKPRHKRLNVCKECLPLAVPPSPTQAEEQIKKLADFILAEIPDEPSQSQGPVDTAIRLLRECKANQPSPTLAELLMPEAAVIVSKRLCAYGMYDCERCRDVRTRGLCEAEAKLCRALWQLAQPAAGKEEK